MSTCRSSREYFDLDTAEDGTPVADPEGILAALMHPWVVRVVDLAIVGGDLDSFAAGTPLDGHEVDFDGAVPTGVFCAACGLVYMPGDGEAVEGSPCPVELEDVLAVADEDTAFLHPAEKALLMEVLAAGAVPVLERLARDD